MTAHQCVLFINSSAGSKRLVWNDTNAGHDNGVSHNFRDCWYDNIGDGTYSQNTNLNLQSEWSSVIDGNGVYDIDPGYTSITDLTPALTSALRTTKKTTTWPTPRMGINGNAYDGSYGAYQGLV